MVVNVEIQELIRRFGRAQAGPGGGLMSDTGGGRRLIPHGASEARLRCTPAPVTTATVNASELRLLGEPTAGRDPEQRVEFRTLLREIGEQATVVVSTHLVEDVGAACDQVALMLDGRIVFCGTPDALSARGHGHT